jgi:hypothetical protein
LKKEKKSGAKVGKKGVSYTTNSVLRRKSSNTDPAPGSKKPGLFFAAKVEKPKNFPVEI